MVLVDERFLEHLYSKQESNWRRPADQVAKSKLTRQMKTDLDKSDIPEDLKVKKYNQDLTRFLQTKRKIPVSEENIIAPAEEKVTQRKEKPTVGRKSIKRSINHLTTSLKSPRIRRLRKAPKRLAWEEW